MTEIQVNLKKLSDMLEEVKLIFEEDRKRAIEHYKILKRQYDEVIQELPFSDDGILEKEMNNALKIINECQKTLYPLITALSKIIDTQLKGQTMREISGNGFNGNGARKIDSPVDLNQLQKYIEDDSSDSH